MACFGRGLKDQHDFKKTKQEDNLALDLVEPHQVSVDLLLKLQIPLHACLLLYQLHRSDE